ncbi:hypothetical protein WJU23_17465 [Prosthecobacter sp. SYSU 5D2]|uniref:hypothetical protein n=1 Tax=Prosthecobacter sp. SYSU 5D2 TaxID=3134134 RepID=UPI0031FE85CC
MTRLLWMLVWIWACPLALAVELLGEPQIRVVGTEATLTWKTDVACGTRVSFGRAEGKPDQKVEGPVTAIHEVTLKDLQKDVTYHFTLGSARQKLHTGSFQTGSAALTPAPPQAAPARSSVLDKVKGFFTPDEKPAASPAATQAQPRAPPTQQTWGRMETLRDHFERHGPDFHSRSMEDYAAQAWHFLQRARAGEVPMKWDDSDATLRIFDPRTRAFAAYGRDGRTKTFFRPGNASYWQRQPGRLIQPSSLPF